ncbi:hypothetical protein FD754_007372 [Muntiacus muntjak]|uniref:Rho-GAP domain-containing protein n=1 Tax=Muntiacus muntjak TaxID=9888 RepID=A0A5N3WSK4_MUNMU|nr:hypothetical protein FD754_007372 [Muntiacus muntjak]
MSGGQRILKGLLGWVSGWTRAWRTGFAVRGCGLRALCPGDPPLPPEELPRRDGADAVSLGPGLEPPSVASNAKATGTLKRPTSLSRHASAAGFPLSGASTWTLGRSHRSPLSAASPAEASIQGPCPDTVEDISHLLADVARFAEGLEKLKECRCIWGIRFRCTKCVRLKTLRMDRHVSCRSERAVDGSSVFSTRPLTAQLPAELFSSASCLSLTAKEGTVISPAGNRSARAMLNTLACSFQGGPLTPAHLSQSPGSASTWRGTSVLQAVMRSFPTGQASAGGWWPGLGGAEPVGVVQEDGQGRGPLLCTLGQPWAEGRAWNPGISSVKWGNDTPCRDDGCDQRSSAYNDGWGNSQTAFSLGGSERRDPRGRDLPAPSYAMYLGLPRRHEGRCAWEECLGKGRSQPPWIPEAPSGLSEFPADSGANPESEECWGQGLHRGLPIGGIQWAELEAHRWGRYSIGPGAGGAASKTLDKRRRLEEEAKNKAEEAMATYRTCVADAKTQKQELEDTKVTALRQIQEVIRQSDQTIKSATISYYQMMHTQTAPLPVHFHMLYESSKLYDPGQQYASHVRQLQRGEEPDVHYDFEPHVSASAWSPVLRARKSSFNVSDAVGSEAAGSPPDEGGPSEGEIAKERRGGRGHQVHKSWPISISDSEASLDPSPGSEDFKKFERMSSCGTMSSNEELADQEGSAGASTFDQADLNGMTPELPVAMPSGPFRHVGLSKAARTHRLRKLRTPAKCRECNSYVYFQGAECEECCLACHKKCLETLAIQCGHKKLQGRLQLFGQDFSHAACSTPDGVPFIIKKCIFEIEQRALRTKGIYRVNGVKTRVEKLCQAFENGKELVELSQASPHDISNVLKLYLRQLPEPLISFRLYHELVGMAKENLKAEAEAKAASRGRPDATESEAAAMAMAGRLRELLQDLPRENWATLRYLMRHLRRIVEVEQDNKMTPGNLGIVFGPTLLRPRPTEATVSLSSLVDYPHQACIVETLITHFSLVFEEEPEEAPGGQDGVSSQRPEVVVQAPYRRGSGDAAFPLTEEAEDGGLEPVASNDSDSELEEASDLQSPAGGAALHRLSFLERQGGEAGTEGSQGSRSGSEEQLGATAGEYGPGAWEGPGEEPARRLSEYNTNQCNNTSHVAAAWLPAVRLRGGRLVGGNSCKRQPEFV